MSDDKPALCEPDTELLADPASASELLALAEPDALPDAAERMSELTWLLAAELAPAETLAVFPPVTLLGFDDFSPPDWALLRALGRVTEVVAVTPYVSGRRVFEARHARQAAWAQDTEDPKDRDESKAEARKARVVVVQEHNQDQDPEDGEEDEDFVDLGEAPDAPLTKKEKDEEPSL